MAPDITIPVEFRPVDDYSSHRPLLFLAMELMPMTPVIELGCGNGSTEVIAGYCVKEKRSFFSLDTNPEWASRFPVTRLIKDYMQSIYLAKAKCDESDINIFENAIVFVDCAPGEIRKTLIAELRDTAAIIIAHDTEPGAEYVYGMKAVLESFRNRVDLLIPGMPYTTAVSEKVDISHIKGQWDEFTVL